MFLVPFYKYGKCLTENKIQNLNQNRGSIKNLVRHSIGKLRLSSTTATQNTRSICFLIALQAKGSIPVFGLLQQQDTKDNIFCKWVSRRQDTQIWVMPLLASKIGLSYRYSVVGYRYCVGGPFWVWVPQWISCQRQPKTSLNGVS